MASTTFKSLNRRQRLLRFRSLAEKALSAYGFNRAETRLIQYNENVIYGVFPANTTSAIAETNSYYADRFILRILATGDEQAVASELAWMDAMANEANLPVPAPVWTLQGERQVRITTEGIPAGRVVSVMRWMKGRKLEKGIRPVHLKALGRVMAGLHEFSTHWQPPEGFKRPTWNWEAQLGGSMFDIPLATLVDSMPNKFREPFKSISAQAKAAMADLGVGVDAFGLIHSDLYPENVLFNAGEAYPIDFEDCGYGYWIWDISVALCTWAWQPDWEIMRDAFREGYQEIRQLPEKQWDLLDLFIATQHATMLLWASVFIQHDPVRIDEYQPWRDESGEKMLGYFNR